MRITGAALLSIVLLAGAARAQEDEAPPVDSATSAIERGADLPLTIYPGKPAHRAIAFVDGGYDGARDAGLVDFVVDAHIWGPLRIRGGGTYVSSEDDLRP